MEKDEFYKKLIVESFKNIFIIKFIEVTLVNKII